MDQFEISIGYSKQLWCLLILLYYTKSVSGRVGTLLQDDMHVPDARLTNQIARFALKT